MPRIGPLITIGFVIAIISLPVIAGYVFILFGLFVLIRARSKHSLDLNKNISEKFKEEIKRAAQLTILPTNDDIKNMDFSAYVSSYFYGLLYIALGAINIFKNSR